MSDSLMFCSHNGVIACYFNNTLNLSHPFSKGTGFFCRHLVNFSFLDSEECEFHLCKACRLACSVFLIEEAGEDIFL